MRGKTRESCPIPGCDGSVLPTSKYHMCGRHTDMTECFLFVLPRVKMEKAPTPKAETQPSGIVVPGTPGYDKAVYGIVKQAK